MKLFRRSLTALLALTLSIVPAIAEDKLGSEDNPIKIFFTPSVDASTITKNSSDFIKYMEKETGLYFKSAVPSNYIAVVEAFG
ncbi:MAG: phosphate/phosphite/phosphonate ABC transporter substrate-binding protein, partial [Bacteriovoracaceae bacterium]|nr:phosphate/phosphite/phosphonate ABC transporter substrate-binding protein [Bacteriovoracaceae bacterium]